MIELIDFNIDERDTLVKSKWLYELQNGGRDYLTGIKVPILMEELGLRDVSVRVNDFFEFVSPKHDEDGYNKHINVFMAEHRFMDDKENSIDISALNARSLLISCGIK